MAKLTVSAEMVAQVLFPDLRCTEIVGATFDPRRGAFDLEIVGGDVPIATEVIAIVTERQHRTVFKAVETKA
jgi:hypothetical protein